MTTKNTPLFQEALIEAKKLREVAETEAKARVVKSITPYIKEMIDKEISEMVLEQEEPLFPDPATQPQTPPTSGGPVDAALQQPLSATPPTPPSPAMPGDMAAASATAALDTPTPPTPVGTDTPPITPPEATMGAGIPLPDESGKIVVDFDDLFEKTPEGQEPNLTGTPDMGVGGVMDTTLPTDTTTTADMEALPVPPEGEASPETPEGTPAMEEEMSYEALKEAIDGYKIKFEAFSKAGKFKSIFVQQLFEERIYELYESLQLLRQQNKIVEKIANLQEQRLELYFKRVKKESLKEANSYSSNSNNNKERDMTTLKKLAKGLFEDGAAGFGDGGEASQKVKNSMEHPQDGGKVDKHAQKASDSTPVEDPGKADSHKLSESPDLEEEIRKLEEELMASMDEGMEGFGDTSEKPDNEPAFSTSTNTKKPSGKSAMPEATDTKEDKDDEEIFEVADDELKMEAVKMKKEALTRKFRALKEEQARVAKALRECGAEMSAGKEATVNVNIHVDDDLAGTTDMDDTELDVVDDVDDVDVSGVDDLDMSSGDDDMVDDIDVVDDDEEEEVSTSPVTMKENKQRGKAVKVDAEKVALRKQLAEHQLLTARTLYLNKFLANENLSKQQKAKIAEYLGSARTVSEAKALYKRITTILAENAKKESAKKGSVGSSSRATTKSGNATPVLQESNQRPGSNIEVPVNRWMELAGIKPKK